MKRTLHFIIILFLLIPGSTILAADDHPNELLPFAIRLNTIEDGANDSMSVIIPFTRAGNLILIQAKAAGQEGNFILDTCAPYLILNLTYFREAKLLPAREGETGGIT